MKLKHAISGAVYELLEDGRVKVENNGLVGYFNADATFDSGELRQADPHMICWLGGPQMPQGAAARRHRG